MRVLVTGAAGLIGTAVLALLAERGIPVTALVLDPVPEIGVPATGVPATGVPATGVPATGVPATGVPATGVSAIQADRVVVGDARDPATVDDALRDVTDVIHLAAIPTPLHDPDEIVFGHNTLATFTVLDRAGRAGVTRASIASSYAICGLPFARRPLRMPYLPLDTGLPLQITDPYALSKQIDEATAAMIHRRYGMSVVAFRLPFVGTAAGRLTEMSGNFVHSPHMGAADLWSYLDDRDAARALVSGLRPAVAGLHILYVAAPETLAPQPTEWLLDRFHPGVPRPAFTGRTVPIDVEPARKLLNFKVEFPFEVRE